MKGNKEMDDMTYKLPPQNLEAEQSLLGAILRDNEIIRKISMSSDDFYRPANRIIYEIMQKMGGEQKLSTF